MSLTRHPLLSRFINVIEGIAPLTLADKSWDNVGLLFESPTVKNTPKCRVLLTIDLTEPVFKEAVDRDVSIILAYHPPWFRGEKSLTLDNNRGMMRMITLCASQGISIYSPHSALDAIDGGLNDHVASKLFGGNIESCNPIQQSLTHVKAGVGRIVILRERISLMQIAQKWSTYSNIASLRVAIPDGKSLDTLIKTIAICVGSGSSIINGISADLYFTGEMSHHEILKSTIAHSACVILTEHTNCERGYLSDVLKSKLEASLEPNSFEILVSSKDKDPIEILTFQN